MSSPGGAPKATQGKREDLQTAEPCEETELELNLLHLRKTETPSKGHSMCRALRRMVCTRRELQPTRGRTATAANEQQHSPWGRPSGGQGACRVESSLGHALVTQRIK